ncbi:glycosyltransferase [Luteimicrobium subarcticum]|uniref:Glycosyltransferase involved in cell wall biosynthesis n=1 Tax=Luteimicrobium subarcticum TaxID=620910 RepID=A0A2M8WVX2_9MICO|nr:glycosyltransferase [Luteimicrobium subarcticum]PJI95074.1 glycosyltransferase involved in cell wall biosynthesis [Luteimicrobium subarcticum]
MSAPALRVLSLYEGFFSGGARALHTTVVVGLHTGGSQVHSALAIHRTVQRETLLQRMTDDPRYRALRQAGVRVATLGRPHDHAAPGFTDRELATVARHAAAADLVVSLKEQPLRLVNQPSFPGTPVVACLHRSDPEHSGVALDDLLAASSSGRLAGAICCAWSTRDAYAAAGVPESLLQVVPNGVDLARFRPVSPARRGSLRAALGLPVDAPVVTIAARYDTMKNVGLFVRAARVWLDATPDGHALACGAGMDHANADLQDDLATVFADRPDLLARLHLLGVRHDMQHVYAATDVVALTSSFGEAAPLCLIEGAMCGAVPVATDVGDAARIVDGIGLVVPTEPDAVAAGWTEAVRRREELEPAREAARTRFSHTRMVAAYATVLEQLHRDATGMRRAAQPRPAVRVGARGARTTA